MTFPAQLNDFLPENTARTWEAIAPIVPPQAYLVGGTALATHLQHRPSEDLDFFYHQHSIDLDVLQADLEGCGDFVATQRDGDTLNGVFETTKLQFLHADAGSSPQRLLDLPRSLAGLQVAGMRDLMATKLSAVAARSELRDYFDIMSMETTSSCSVELGLQYFLERYRPRVADDALMSVVVALGYLDDVDEDHQVPLPKDEIAAYWQRRQPVIARSLSRR